MKEDDVKQAPLAIERLIDVKKLWYRIRILYYEDFLDLVKQYFFLRSITMLVTSLSKYSTSEEILSRYIQIFLFPRLSIQENINLIRKEKGNIFYFFLSFDTTSDFYVIHLLSWFCSIYGMILILAGYEHYSIGISIVFFLTSRLFLYYHSLTNNTVLYSSSDSRLSIWFSMFLYL
ncbi:unnamed protein product [Rotaria sordida]|uniref:Sphingomyelin synthase-like domain-containing protein n=1 Tax=Rotaria sordida TaxID=392033 RepID=A0A818Y247_9BILA|nr:unnamed protein product [Rotaria sordida]